MIGSIAEAKQDAKIKLHTSFRTDHAEYKNTEQFLYQFTAEHSMKYRGTCFLDNLEIIIAEPHTHLGK